MSEELVRQWLAAVLDVSTQFTVLVAIVAAALFVLRSLPPRVRHVMWLVVLLRLAIPAGLTSPWGVLPASFAHPPSAVLPPAADGTRVFRGIRIERGRRRSNDAVRRSHAGDATQCDHVIRRLAVHGVVYRRPRPPDPPGGSIRAVPTAFGSGRGAASG